MKFQIYEHKKIRKIYVIYYIYVSSYIISAEIYIKCIFHIFQIRSGVKYYRYITNIFEHVKIRVVRLHVHNEKRIVVQNNKTYLSIYLAS